MPGIVRPHFPYPPAWFSPALSRTKESMYLQVASLVRDDMILALWLGSEHIPRVASPVPALRQAQLEAQTPQPPTHLIRHRLAWRHHKT